MTTSLESYQSLAARHLPPDAAARWTALLRPCVRLHKATGDEPAAARLGGEPLLPVGAEWPQWPDHGPLSFIASVDCGALPGHGLDPAFPTEGTLLFFHFDGQLDDGDALVWASDPSTWEGARVLYVPAGTETAAAATPEGLEPYPAVALAATARHSAPDPWHPQALAAVDGGDPTQEPGPTPPPPHVKAFTDALFAEADGIGHQIGGHARPVQGPVEYEMAHGVLGPGTSWTDPALGDEAREWVPLAQFDSDDDAGMMWGDCGTLYWLIRPADLAARRFDEARFTWQCC